MQKFLQAVMASVFFLTITTGMASEHGHRATVRENRSAFQSRIPLRVAAGRMASLGSSLRNIAEEETIWQDDFEQGVNGWTVESAFDRQTYWHPSSQGAFGGSGSSYWCGDPALNGYDNDWFQLLVTPEIDLSGTTAPTLTFKHNYAVEDPAGASQSIPQIDGWDGVAVRVSTDGGNTFVPLTPAAGYPHQSLFGFVRVYGFGAPGWANRSSGWVDATFDLSSYIGQKIILRFEFGSDPGFSTQDEASLFGWRVDNIKVADGANSLFFDDAGDSAGPNMTAAVLPPKLYWHMVTTRANSPTHSWWCGEDATARYPNYIWNYLVSPQIAIPPTGQNNATWFRIYLDFQHYYSMEYDSFNNKFDFFGVEISDDGGVTWTNPTGFVYVGSSSDRWIPFEDSYSASIDLTALAGKTVQFRWQFFSDYSVKDIGFFLDDPVVVGISGLPNDVSTADLDVAYPNIAGQPIKTIVEVANVGINDQSTVPLWYQINSDPQMPVPPLFPVPSGSSTLRDFTWTVPTANDYHLTVFTTLPADDDLSNDTLSTRTLLTPPLPIRVTPPGLAVLGYEDRFNPTFVAATDRIVHFTPRADIPSMGSYDLQAVAVLFFNQSQSRSDQLHVKIGTAASPTTFENVLLERDESIPPNDFRFHSFDLSGVADAKNLNKGFLVHVDYTASNGNAGVVLDDRTRFTGHNYFFDPDSQRLRATDFGAFINSSIRYLPTAVEEQTPASLPQEFTLYANYPNPVRSARGRLNHGVLQSVTRISFDLPQPSHVRIKVYDITGRRIATLLDERRPAGHQSVKWNVAGLPAGTYFYKMEAGEFEAVRKMLVL